MYYYYYDGFSHGIPKPPLPLRLCRFWPEPTSLVRTISARYNNRVRFKSGSQIFEYQRVPPLQPSSSLAVETDRHPMIGRPLPFMHHSWSYCVDECFKKKIISLFERCKSEKRDNKRTQHAHRLRRRTVSTAVGRIVLFCCCIIANVIVKLRAQPKPAVVEKRTKHACKTGGFSSNTVKRHLYVFLKNIKCVPWWHQMYVTFSSFREYSKSKRFCFLLDYHLGCPRCLPPPVTTGLKPQAPPPRPPGRGWNCERDIFPRFPRATRRYSVVRAKCLISSALFTRCDGVSTQCRTTGSLISSPATSSVENRLCTINVPVPTCVWGVYRVWHFHDNNCRATECVTCSLYWLRV